jgi:hypothetical protein
LRSDNPLKITNKKLKLKTKGCYGYMNLKNSGFLKGFSMRCLDNRLAK